MLDYLINNSLSDVSDSISAISAILSQSDSGQFILPSGLKIEWGTALATYANPNVLVKNVAFKTAFSSIPTITTGLIKDNSAFVLETNVGVTNLTKTGMSLCVQRNSSIFDSASKLTVHWIAIGY